MRKNCHSAGRRRERGRKTVVERGLSKLRILKEVRSDAGGSSIRTHHTSEQRRESANKDPPGPALPGPGNSPEDQKGGKSLVKQALKEERQC